MTIQYIMGKKTSFYQICYYKNINKLYEVRKIYFNDEYKIIKVSTNEYEREELDKFMKMTSESKYKIYPTYDITTVGYPTTDDMVVAISELTN